MTITLANDRVPVTVNSLIPTNIELSAPPVSIMINEVSEETLDSVKDGIAAAIKSKQPILPVYIHSYGGEVYTMQAIQEELANCPLQVATIAQGKAMSAGAMILASGDLGYRYATKNTTILIHDLSAGVWGRQPEIEAASKQYKKLNKKMWKQLALYCGHEDEFYFYRMVYEANSDVYLTAKQAKKHKLIDHIGLPKLTAEIAISYDFG